MLRPRETRQRSFFDASWLVGSEHGFDFARFYAREILPLVTDADFEEFYSDRGRPAVSPSLLFHVLVLATLEGLSDRQAVHAVEVRLDWRVALKLRLDFPRFDSTRLVSFRSRFLKRDSTNEHREATDEEKKSARVLFDRMVSKLVDLGLVEKGQPVRLDSTHVVSAAKNINRYQTIFESMKLAVRALETSAPEILGDARVEGFHEKYSKPLGAYDLKRERVRKNLEVAVKDAVRLLNVLDAHVHAKVRRLDAVEVLAKAVKDNVELRRKGTKRARGRPAKDSSDGSLSEAEIASVGQVGGLSEDDVEVVERQTGDRMITPHDRTARLGVKSAGKMRWVGQKLHATETVPEATGKPAFLVDGEMVHANDPDVTQTLPTLQRLRERGLTPRRAYVDAGYVSGETVSVATSSYGVEIYGPPAEPRSSGRIPVEEFSANYDSDEATCPAGKRSDRFTRRYDGERLLGAEARFSSSTCEGCPLASRCLTQGDAGRKVVFTAHHEALVAQRKKARTAQFKAEYKKRSPCEGIFSEMAGPLGLRRSSLKGELKTYFEHFLGLTTINAKRLYKTMASRPELASTG